METRIRDVMSNDVSFVTAEDSLEEVARQQRDDDCGVVPVTDQVGRIRGMMTDRDICMAAFRTNLPLSELRVESAMSSWVFCCHEEDRVSDVLLTMAKRRVRRMPVVDDEGRLLGIVSLNDLAIASAGGAIDPAEVVAAQAAICAPSKKPARSVA